MGELGYYRRVESRFKHKKLQGLFFKITFKKYIADVTVFLTCHRNTKVTITEKREVSAQFFPV